MNANDDPTTRPSARDTDAEVIAFLADRSVPCPRCAYDLRDIRKAMCPECGEPLVLKIGTPRPRFGWLVLAMAPGCFSGVAAVFALVPIALTILRFYPPGNGAPWQLVVADAFGFLSAASVVWMYRHRHRFMAWSDRRQRSAAMFVWAVHILMFVLVVAAVAIWQ